MFAVADYPVTYTVLFVGPRLHLASASGLEVPQTVPCGLHTIAPYFRCHEVQGGAQGIQGVGVAPGSVCTKPDKACDCRESLNSRFMTHLSKIGESCKVI